MRFFRGPIPIKKNMVGMDRDKELESNCFLQPKSHLTPFITKIMDMLKKPTIEAELGKVLQEFVSRLDDCEKHLNNGIASMNFAEIALLIQNSANLYSKKVDILWDFILDYQQRIISKENNLKENEVERDKLEERKRKYKRRRKTNVNNSEISTILDKFSFGNSADLHDNVDYLNKAWDRHGLELKWQKFDSSATTTCSGIRHESSQQLFMPTDAIYSEDNEYIGRYNQFHAVSCLFKAETSSSTSTPLTFNNNNNYIKEMRPVSCCSRRLSFASESSPCKLPFIVLKPLPDEVLAEKLHRPLSSFSDKCRNAEEEEQLRKKMRRMSLADSLLDNDEPDTFFSEFEEDDESVAAPPIEKRNKSISQESGFFEDLDETVSSKSLGRSRVVLVERQRGMVKVERIVNKSLKTKSPRKKRINRKLIEKLSQGLSAKLCDFEQFLQLHYKPADGEGEKVPASPLRSIAEESEDEDGDNLPEAAQSPSPVPEEEVVAAPEPEEETRPPDSANLDDSKRTVSEWRASIIPKLRDAVKSTFDIHEYGANILKEVELGEEKLFKDVVKNKSRREVNAYFLAALHLANTRNVEITGGQPGQISNETFQLKVISKKRHHEVLEEYEAPSSNRNNRTSSNHSKEEPPRKRIKLTVKNMQ